MGVAPLAFDSFLVAPQIVIQEEHARGMAIRGGKDHLPTGAILGPAVAGNRSQPQGSELGNEDAAQHGISGFKIFLGRDQIHLLVIGRSGPGRP